MGQKGSAGKGIKIIFDDWMYNEIQKIADDNKTTFKKIVVKFCENELKLGYGITSGIGTDRLNIPAVTLDINKPKKDAGTGKLSQAV